jgi:hypothetical protein
MKTRMKTRLLVSMVVFAAMATSTLGQSLHAGQSLPLAIIVAKASPINELSSAQLSRMFMGERVDTGGSRFIPLNRSTATEERQQFDRVVLGKSPDEMARYWIDRKIRGQSGAPKAVEPVDVYARVIAKLDGAVGYVRLGDVRGDVKIVRIDGKAPHEPGYPVRF